ncbi:MAG: hypothetical protein WKF81_03980 [Thermomicrobiales bacterium]
MSTSRWHRLTHKIYPPVVLGVVFSLSLASPVSAQIAEELIEEIETSVVELRGLEVLTPIVVSYRTREELQEEVASDFQEDYPIEDSERDQRTMIAFGIIEEGTDIRDLYTELYGGQIAGYYDPTTGELVVVLDGDGSSEELTASEEFTLAHEINHALQDQHFDIDAGAFDSTDVTDDVSLATTGLIEGDAVLLQGLYLQGDPSFARALSREYADLEDTSDSLDEFPPVIVSLLYFPYDLGYEFVNDLYEEGGYELVDEAFVTPPTTTEQILHPEKFLDGEVGAVVEVNDFASILGSDWVDTDDNSFGEYLISQLLISENVDDGDASDAAEGWNGDRYKVAGNDDDSAVTWQTFWDSDDDADEFAEAAAAWASDRLGADVDEDDGTYVIESDNLSIMIVVDGDSVVYTLAPDLASAQLLADAQAAGQ